MSKAKIKHFDDGRVGFSNVPLPEGAGRFGNPTGEHIKKCPKRGAHCWHANGRGVTDGMAREGQHEGQCCHCGRTYWRNWKMASTPLRGHGSHVTERTYEYYDDQPQPKEQT